MNPRTWQARRPAPQPMSPLLFFPIKMMVKQTIWHLLFLLLERDILPRGLRSGGALEPFRGSHNNGSGHGSILHFHALTSILPGAESTFPVFIKIYTYETISYRCWCGQVAVI